MKFKLFTLTLILGVPAAYSASGFAKNHQLPLATVQPLESGQSPEPGQDFLHQPSLQNQLQRAHELELEAQWGAPH